MAAPDPERLAQELRLALGLLLRRLRQGDAGDGELTMPEASALARLERGGPATSAQLARSEQISPQSMGTTIEALRRRGLVAGAPDPRDGRRVVLSLTPAGAEALHERRNARTERLAGALRAELSGSELRTLAAAVELLERLGEAL
jgi:DNA-binding MarR family transcriptional regulator